MAGLVDDWHRLLWAGASPRHLSPFRLPLEALWTLPSCGFCNFAILLPSSFLFSSANETLTTWWAADGSFPKTPNFRRHSDGAVLACDSASKMEFSPLSSMSSVSSMSFRRPPTPFSKGLQTPKGHPHSAKRCLLAYRTMSSALSLPYRAGPPPACLDWAPARPKKKQPYDSLRPTRVRWNVKSVSLSPGRSLRTLHVALPARGPLP
ncbi:hypothetical protein B0H67DRAFT_742 [Lasiosphaeris hirsuta]|uniref:Uncharacterized protein n=1 Tax=Lasiosphaeris hirsuta TaxID=260670 RepID=A0AA40B8A5_9PEZI|nr:hypothetical protein B0H67DRAFT_742 [Lasiosphaeris hirsuta]